jgi:hypothetical protein
VERSGEGEERGGVEQTREKRRGAKGTEWIRKEQSRLDWT